MFYNYYDSLSGVPFYGINNASSYIRLLHASPGAPAVDVYANDMLIAQNLAYRGFTPYLKVDPGEYRVAVYPTGTKTNAVIDTKLSIPPYTIYTVAAIGQLPNLSLLPVLDPRITIPPGMVMVRFVHLSPDAPAVDITTGDGTPLFTNVSYKHISNYIPVPPGTYTLQARITGTDDFVLHVPNVTLQPNRFYSVYAIGLAADEPTLQVLIPLDGNSYLTF